LPQYRLYTVGPADRLEPAATFDSAGDADAVARAAQRRQEGRAAELWSGGRRVGRFSKLGVFTRA
jgi:hypothetical protein